MLNFKIQPRSKGYEGRLIKKGKTFGRLVKRFYKIDWEGTHAVLLYGSSLPLSSRSKKISLERCFVSKDAVDLKSGLKSSITLEFRDVKPGEIIKKQLYAPSEQDRLHWVEVLKLCCAQSSIDNPYIIDREKILGSGISGIVYRAVERGGQKTEWAIKEILKKSIRSDLAEEALKEEVKLCGILKTHDHIVCMKEYFETAEKLCLVMEIVPGGDLVDRIVDPPGGRFTEADAAHVFRQLLSGLEYIHSLSIVHRDLKLDNMLMTSRQADAKVKIADFGAARMAYTPTSLRDICGTCGYIAPEVVKCTSTSGYGRPADMWSMGVVLFTILAGTVPFTGATDEESFALTVEGKYDEAKLARASEPARALVASLLVLDPAKRLTAGAALKDPWLAISARAADPLPLEVLEGLRAERQAQRVRLVATQGAVMMARFRRMVSDGHITIRLDDSDPIPPPLGPHAIGSPTHAPSAPLAFKGDASPPQALRGSSWLPPTPMASTRRHSQVTLSGLSVDAAALAAAAAAAATTTTPVAAKTTPTAGAGGGGGQARVVGTAASRRMSSYRRRSEGDTRLADDAASERAAAAAADELAAAAAAALRRDGSVEWSDPCVLAELCLSVSPQCVQTSAFPVAKPPPLAEPAPSAAPPVAAAPSGSAVTVVAAGSASSLAEWEGAKVKEPPVRGAYLGDGEDSFNLRLPQCS